MKIYIILIVCLFSFSYTGHAQTFTVRGKVTDTDGAKIPAATIRILENGKSTKTDSLGHFSLVINKSAIQAEISAVGYKRSTIKLTEGMGNRTIMLEKDQQHIDQVTVQGRHINANTETLVKIENSIMPVTVIDRRTIELMGSRRLDEIVKEQTGIAIVNDIGAGARAVGVQMQGFGSEYVMILIDGQPIVGRNNGNFDLSRISVSNIERIEITKGAASNIYGGDALGGTINIITRQTVLQPQAVASAMYGSNETVDVSFDGETPLLKKKATLSMGANYYHTGGFNTSQGLITGSTLPPYDNYAAHGRFRYKFNDNNAFSVSARYGMRRSFMNKAFMGTNYQTEDVLDEKDLNLMANFDHRFNARWRSMTRYYYTRFDVDMFVALSQGDSLNQTNFGQDLHRLEQQIAYSIPNKLDVITGVGGTIERIDQNILTTNNEIKSYFAYSQANWKALPRLDITFGLRYDNIAKYGWRLDPSAALQYRILPNLSAKMAYSTAFKAPDMKKLYQVSYDPGINSMLLGTASMRDVINQLRESGQVSQYELEPIYDEIKGLALNAEMSKSYNLSLIWENTNRKFRAEASVFYHDIKNQINRVLIGMDITGGLIYSYRNNPEAYYQGADFSFSYKLWNNLHLSGGYQFLIAKDRSIAKEIGEGGKYNTPLFDPQGGSVNYFPTSKDYWGIENRSNHMFNARVFYTYEPAHMTFNIRMNYRGKYPFSDRNNNGYLDRYDTFVRGHYLLNAGVEKKFPKQRLAVRATTENMLNFVDAKMPFQPGRVYFMGLTYQLYSDK
ncbi:TonB-dependent receptor [Sphingobacterium psychroaquaticum]|uniref:Outer membrane receptor for ferrienterochelin and colicins n=1 Tax=Sphingobacterium psychroaquaticum TaxID=561061 RepID=A0A1X7HVT7_9SPHI|nr:TonB-dependent receptor [Sphingobacterium psychroaquaticum]SMG06114.1 outer membrane receptor for ferrienterochelin and colicins [Sphingobacterium psychroaquaticum]